MTDFYNNLISLTNNLEDIAFTKYATITNINSDGTCTAKEDEEEGLTHENINTLGNNLRVGDKVVLGFVDNSIYNPVILTGGEEAYTKTETDALLQKKINEPINEGSNGQVLTTDGNGGRTWKTVQGGGSDVDIVTSWEPTPSDTKVPSEKLTKNTLDTKVDKVTGKGLSANDFTNSYKNTIDGLSTVATTGDYDDLTDKPTIPSKISDLTNDSDFIEKSSTNGLVKNDGSVDTTQYLSSLPSHNHDDRYYTESEVDTALNGKQATLISGTNIKTINNTSLLGSGNISIQGGGTVTVDDSLSTTSTNPVQNKVITGALNGKANSSHTHISSDVTDLIDVIYPIGSIYMSVNSVNPSTLFGGTWEQIKDTFLLSSGDTYSNGATGGSANAVVVSHTHTQNQHRHELTGSKTSGFSSGNYLRAGYGSATDGQYTNYATPTINSTGEDGTGKNMPPYIVVNVWKRTA